MLTRTTPTLLLTLLILTACSESYDDDPSIEVSLPYSDPLVIGADVMIDVNSRGCESSVSEIVFSHQNKTVTRVKVGIASAPTRVAVSTKNLDLSDRSAYPAQVTLKARLVCRSGFSAESNAVSFDLLPAAERMGDSRTQWPSYQFWPQPDGTFLFCGDSALHRLDRDGSVLSVSAPFLRCPTSMTLERHAGLLVLRDRDDMTILDEALDIRLQTTAQAFDVQGDTLVLVEDESRTPGSPLLVRAVSLATGETLWQSRLDEPDMDWLMTDPLIDPETQAVYIVTVSVSASPLEPHFVVWRIDAQNAETPERVHTGEPTVVNDTLGDVFVVPRGELLSRTKILFTEPGVENGTIGDSTLVKVLDMSRNTILWSQQIEGQALIHQAGNRRVVASSEGMLLIGENGQLEAEWAVLPGNRIILEALSPHGAVIFSLRNEAGDQSMVTMLDNRWSEVWSVPYDYAFGAAFDGDGNAWWHSSELLRLHTADDYRLRIR